MVSDLRAIEGSGSEPWKRRRYARKEPVTWARRSCHHSDVSTHLHHSSPSSNLAPDHLSSQYLGARILHALPKVSLTTRAVCTVNTGWTGIITLRSCTLFALFAAYIGLHFIRSLCCSMTFSCMAGIIHFYIGYIPLNHTPFFLLHASCGVKADRCICHRMPQTSIRPQYRTHGCRRMHQRLARLSDSFAILDHTFSTTSSNSRIRFFASSSSLP